MHITARRVDAGFLEERVSDVKNLQLSAGSRSIGRDKGILRPAQNGVHPNFLRGNVGNCDVFCGVAEVRDIRFDRQALAKVFGCGLQHSIITAFAGARSTPQAQRADQTQQGWDPKSHPPS